MKRLAGISAVGLLGIASAFAQTYPSRPVKAIIGFPPGSTIDVITRTMAEAMAEELGQAVITDNRPGAGGTIATQAVARAAPDGYTVNISGCSADAIVYAFVMSDRPPLDPFKDFTPVGRLMRDHWVVAASSMLGVASVSELVALARKTDALSFPSNGVGSSQHLQAERFRMRVGIKATHVPYKDSPLPDLLAGRLSFTIQSTPAIASHIKSGKLKALAVLSPERLPLMPEVPTIAEAGFPDLVYNAGVCMYAPGGTPRDVVLRLNSALNKASASKQLRQRFAELGVEPVYGTPQDAAQFVGEMMELVDRLRTAVLGKAR
jgi:tripartite-type tricarboxylate transporter receptor subunit TctC